MDKKTFLSDRQEGLRPGVVVCVIDRDSKILLGKKEKYQIWELPQGGIAENENLESAIKREIIEELGNSFLPAIFVPEQPLVHIDQVIFPENTVKEKFLSAGEKSFPMLGKKYYFCLAAKTKDIEPEKFEYQDFKWVSYDEGIKLIEAIPQKGKKRILKTIFSILKENQFIK
jgi:NADH pyrophosphatase NudC (nudix superfamily)